MWRSPMRIKANQKENAVANRLLVVKNDLSSSDDLRTRYKDQNWKVYEANDTEEALKMVSGGDIDPHVICAAIYSNKSAVLKAMYKTDSFLEHTEWVFLVDKESRLDDDLLDDIDYTFVEKPFNKRHVDNAIKRALRSSLTSRRLECYAAGQIKQNRLESFVGSSHEVTELKDMLSQLAEVPISSMIIAGETGAGKGLVARILHNIGLRKDGPMVELNCAALPRDLLESQLFGHETGAFTGAKTRHRGLFEQADNGTLFLDEIGDMDIDLQAKVLKAIEDKRIRRLGSEREIEVDVQIIAATAKDLEQAYKNKEFREDLYHRLSVFCVTIPPLRNRKKDLVELVPQIVAEFNAIAGRHVETIDDQVWEAIIDYDWPGNVRELRNVIERCVLMSKSTEFPEEWLQLKTHCAPDESNVENIKSKSDYIELPLDGSMALDEMDKHIIQNALRENDFNVTETARVLKTTRETIRYRIQKYDLETSA